ncbi:MAG: hypothetical protein IJS13_09560 [Paludibacteraceae bacterium]|nr:hypothetical protein [Paludibacteraceae bacterium]
MKRHYIYPAVAAFILLVSCNAPVPEENKLFVSESDAAAATHTINELLDQYMVENDFTPVRTNDGGAGLYMIDSIPSEGPDIIIRGRVVTEDYAGNFYKTIVIQDAAHPEQGLRISVDMSNAGGQYAIGQLMNIRVNGLSIGKYANQPQLCVPSYNDNIYAYHAGQKVGWAPGRIPAARFAKAVTLIGLPDKSKIDTIEITIPEIKALADKVKADGMFIRIKNVRFNGKDSDGTDLNPSLDPSDPNLQFDNYSNTFAPSTGNVGFPRSRQIEDNNGNIFYVSTSEYAKFAYALIPCSTYEGSVTGVLGYYQDKASGAGDDTNWSLSISSLAALNLVDDEGNAWDYNNPRYWNKGADNNSCK